LPLVVAAIEQWSKNLTSDISSVSCPLWQEWLFRLSIDADQCDVGFRFPFSPLGSTIPLRTNAPQRTDTTDREDGDMTGQYIKASGGTGLM
jgi:hypothetical protein